MHERYKITEARYFLARNTHYRAYHAACFTYAPKSPFDRTGRVRDIVEAVLYLETAPFVTGQIRHVDRGSSAGRD